MSRLISQFLNPLKNGHQQKYAAPAPPPSSPCTLSLCHSKRDPDNLHVRPYGYHEDAAPLYFAKTSEHKKPHVVISRGGGPPLATAIFHNFSSKIDVTFHGRDIPMKTSSWSGDYRLDAPSMGKLKWKVNKLTGSSMELLDSSGKTLAHVKGDGFPGSGKKKLKVLVPCNHYTMDLIVASALIARVMTVQVMKAAAEGAGAAS